VTDEAASREPAPEETINGYRKDDLHR